MSELCYTANLPRLSSLNHRLLITETPSSSSSEKKEGDLDSSHRPLGRKRVGIRASLIRLGLRPLLANIRLVKQCEIRDRRSDRAVALDRRTVFCRTTAGRGETDSVFVTSMLVAHTQPESISQTPNFRFEDADHVMQPCLVL